ncbi:zf-DHHC-domain-containing protein [Backusella circina FSU 941]|nr:zf-DHHC-domain-containing protein [Backusella circina FSU 941]
MLDSLPGKLYILGVVVLITFIGYSSQLVIFYNAFDWKALLPLNVLIVLVYYNYYLAVITEPGEIPMNWEPPLLSPIKELPAEGITGPRFCKTCNVYKPPRSHHCRYCRRCVLKMDHHCPWINNCVGHANHGHFLRFLVYVSSACTFVLVLLVTRVKNILMAIQRFEFDAEPDTFQVVFIIINFLLTFIVLFSVGILTLYQIYCVARNQTTIEAWERGKVNKLIRRGKITAVLYPFDIGIYKNICTVLGSFPLLWLVPQKIKGDGLSFPVRDQTDARLPYYWPPRDPEELKPSIFSMKYKRMQQTKRLLQKDPMAVLPEQEDEFYDSGSASDIDSIGHEEEGIGMYAYYEDQSLHLQQSIDENDADTSDDDDDDTTPLAQYHHRTSPTKKID